MYAYITPSDIPLLLNHFLEKYNFLLGKEIRGWDSEAKEILCGYLWPGNIRELQNAVEYAVNDCGGTMITTANLPQKIVNGAGKDAALPLKALKEVEASYIEQAFRFYGNSAEGKEKAAAVLGLSRSTYYRRLAELGLK